MSVVRILGVFLLLASASLFLLANYISVQVEAGSGQIESGQSEVDTTRSLFSLSPETKGVGNLLTSPAQSRINEGQLQVARYGALIMPIQIASVACLVFGVLLLIFGGKKRYH